MTDALLKVNMLGEFSLSCNDVTVSDQNNRSKRLWGLLEYLVVFRDREIRQSELVDIFWPNGEIANPVNTLKTLLHRARGAVAELGFSGGKELVVSRRGGYHWNEAIPIQLDIDLFDACCRDAAACDDSARQLELLLQAISLYQGKFLPKNAAEPWVLPISAYLHSRFIEAVHAALTLLCAADRYGEARAICQKAVVIDPYEESFHKAMLLMLSKTGSPQAAIKHYEYVTELFFNEFGVTPSEELMGIYREICKTENNRELDLSVIRENLRDTAQLPGAFFCEYEFFKDIYRLNARASARSGQVIQIALLTLTDRAGKHLDQKTLRLSMNHLKDIIAISLRRGDAYTRCSISQYLLMLPSASYENSTAVLTRIERSYRRQYPKANVAIQRRLLPLDPES